MRTGGDTGDGSEDRRGSRRGQSGRKLLAVFAVAIVVVPAVVLPVTGAISGNSLLASAGNHTRTPTPNATAQAADARSVVVGERITGEIDAADPAADRYSGHYEPVSVDVTAGTVVRISADPASGDAHLYLLAPNGTVVAQAESFASNRFEQYQFAESGTYTIAVGSRLDDHFEYDLSVREVRTPTDLRTVSVGTTADGEVDLTDPRSETYNGYYEPVSVSLSAGTTTSISVSPTDRGSAHLYVVGPNGSVLEQRETFDGAVLPHFDAPTSGTYTLAVGSWQDDRFNYSVAVRETRTPTDLRSLAVDEAGTGEIDSDDSYAERFGGYYEPVTLDASAGTTARITVSPENTGGASLALIAPNGTVVRQQASHGGAAVPHHTFTASGQYTVAVGSTLDGRFNYSLDVTETTEPADRRELSFGANATSDLDVDDPYDSDYGGVYEPISFDVTAGTTATLTAVSSAGSPTLHLLAPNGTTVASDESWDDARLPVHTFGQSGEYTAIVGSLYDSEFEYTVTADRVRTPTDLGSVTPGDSAAGELDPTDPTDSRFGGHYEPVSVPVQAATNLTLSVTASGDADLYLRDESGAVLARDAGFGAPSIRNYTVATAGTYEVVVGSQWDQTFNYTLVTESTRLATASENASVDSPDGGASTD